MINPIKIGTRKVNGEENGCIDDGCFQSKCENCSLPEHEICKVLGIRVAKKVEAVHRNEYKFTGL